MQTKTMTRRTAVAALFIGATSRAMAQAGAWPARPVKVIVPFAAGGTVDIVSRYLAERFGALLGQPFIIDNRPGAGGNMGTEMVVRAPNDGYTLLISGSPTIAVNPHLYKNLSYDPITDMFPVALIATAPNLLVVNPLLPVKTVEDLVALARSKPGQLSFSSAGNGTSGHLAGELFRRLAQVDIQHVPYKGQADAITGVIRGDVAFAFVTVAGTLQQVKAGRLRAIAITSKARSVLAPDVPTVVQSGFPDFEVLAWYSMAAPKGTPPDIVARLTREMDKVMKEPATLERLHILGAEPSFLAGQAFVDFMVKDSARWGKVIREAAVTVN
ncbi:MAG: tripartite tricarboxylate transporter substrate binding protein [Burkholderiaceae bacterium]|nr:tripartite tricarboxylate transporter substrate binding protein [Burkholderiaceae bacterium]